MRTKASAGVLALVVLAALVAARSGSPAGPPALSPNVSVIASGLNNPRGLTFGPDGNLYVAEGGTGGTASTTTAQCPQVPAPIGPYKGGATADIVRFSATGGSRTVVASGLPSDQTSAQSGGLMSGVSSLAFVGPTLYALLSAGGCSHGNPATPNAVLRVNANGSTSLLANLSAFQAAHPVAKPEPDDFEPDGTWYSMVAVGGSLFAVDPNHGEIDRIALADGAVTRLADISATQGHIVPTSIVAGKGAFYVGNLGTFPVTPGTEKILQVSPTGAVQVWATGLSTVLGLAVDKVGRLYALESMTQPGEPSAAQLGSGKILRLDGAKHFTLIASGLSFPTGMTMGPDGALYVSNVGFGAPGGGQILKVTLPAAKAKKH